MKVVVAVYSRFETKEGELEFETGEIFEGPFSFCLFKSIRAPRTNFRPTRGPPDKKTLKVISEKKGWYSAKSRLTGEIGKIPSNYFCSGEYVRPDHKFGPGPTRFGPFLYLTVKLCR